jgi:endoglucanase
MGGSGTGGGGTGGGGSGGAGGGGGATPTPPLTGLHVDGSQIKNDAGQLVRLHGVNRSGTEYRCAQSMAATAAIFDGPSDDASIQVMTTWNVNAVRIPLNEDCWLGINGVAAVNAGANYKNAIKTYVGLIESHNMAPILELHWSAPGTILALRQQPMPDADHSPAFWTDVATTFAGDTRVVFEPFNEPFPDGNKNSTAAWTCWRDGCTANLSVATGQPAMTYQAAGFQSLVTAIRGTGAPNLILLGGVQYSNTLAMWAAFKPTDVMNNLAPAWHIYNFNGCASATCWNAAPATLAMTYPIVATEFGENDCMGGTFVTSLMQWLDSHGGSLLAWTWDAYGACTAGTATGSGGQPWSLVTSYTSGTPNAGFSQAVHDHFLGL